MTIIMRTNTGIYRWNFALLLWMSYALLFFNGWVVSSASPGVRQLQNDPEQLSLSSSAFSASSVYKKQNEFEAHKANSAVFSSHEESFGAWCPAEPVQNYLTEWLQVDFGSMKIMRVLFTEGHPNKQDAYVPSFVIRYQRQAGEQWHEYRMRNGSKLLHANRDSQTIATELDPPIVAKRFRLYPYNNLEPRFMCLRLAIYGSEFKDSVVEYVIPEGDVYQGMAAFNDTIYDGFWTRDYSSSPKLANKEAKRAYLYGGIGVLMDKQYYEGDLPEQDDRHNIVGWYRNRYPTMSDRVSMLFVFDQVRNFTQLQFHALRVSDNQGLFQQILIQFSNDGDHFDSQSKPILSSTAMDARSQSQWISVDLKQHVGRYVRLTLWFNGDWIILSEITFESTPAVNFSTTVALEISSDLLNQLENLELPEIDFAVPYAEVAQATATRPVAESLIYPPTPSQNLPTVTNVHKRDSGVTHIKGQSSAVKLNENTFTDSTSKYRNSTTPYIVAILCCFLGSILFVILLAFTLCRLRQSRVKRMKKQQKVLQHMDGNNKSNHNHHYHHPLLLSSTQPLQQSQQCSQNYILASDTPTFNNQNAINLLSEPVLSSLLPNNGQYNQVATSHPISAFAAGYPNLTMTSLMTTQQQNALPLIGQLPDSLNPSAYTQYGPGIDQDTLLRLLQQGSSVPANSSLSGLTLTRPETLDTLNIQNQFVLNPTNSLINALPPSTIGNIFPIGQYSTQLRYHPHPPPPNQPLPPLPPPSSSPDSTAAAVSETAAAQSTEHFNANRMGSGNAGGANVLSSYAVNNNPFIPDSGFLFPFDGSMPEYASASLFSGVGLNHPCLTGSTISSVTEMDTLNKRFLSTDTAYCVPHLNAVHQQWFYPNSSLNPGGIDMSINPSNITMQPKYNEFDQSSNVDSNGMYYMINRTEKFPLLNFSHISQPADDATNPPQTILLPFNSPQFHGLPLTQSYQLVNGQQADSGVVSCHTLTQNQSKMSTIDGVTDFASHPPHTELDLTTSCPPLPQQASNISAVQ